MVSAAKVDRLCKPLERHKIPGVFTCNRACKQIDRGADPNRRHNRHFIQNTRTVILVVHGHHFCADVNSVRNHHVDELWGNHLLKETSTVVCKRVGRRVLRACSPPLSAAVLKRHQLTEESRPLLERAEPLESLPTIPRLLPLVVCKLGTEAGHLDPDTGPPQDGEATRHAMLASEPLQHKIDVTSDHQLKHLACFTVGTCAMFGHWAECHNPHLLLLDHIDQDLCLTTVRCCTPHVHHEPRWHVCPRCLEPHPAPPHSATPAAAAPCFAHGRSLRAGKLGSCPWVVSSETSKLQCRPSARPQMNCTTRRAEQRCLGIQ
eukprot:m.230190 g.230190  ORF g.230190 m.230190 type:complete len:319 (-) comp26018_c0_seq1:133-1089(-)